ncbi:PorP/SprF family type IX secretion system membrane protein [Flavobacterium cyanobacteriorum]|nr:PorP/SprF family type IX secretion system membrane protein [Flavobacterium cyanobacteriorum]
MAQNYIALLLIIIMGAFSGLNAQDAPVLTFNIPVQNNVKYNRFLLNPAFSFVREDNKNIVLYHRNQWFRFDDSPKLYMLSYSGKFSEKTGLGIGLYRQNLGVLSSFGGIANYAYNITLMEKMNLTLGFNLAYYNSGVDKARIIAQEPDPAILAMRDNSILSLKPGINFNYRSFDFGAYLENYIDYDFKSGQMTEDYTDRTYSGHIMYTYAFESREGIFGNGDIKFLLRGRKSEEASLTINGNVLLHFPRTGWFQAGVDDFYGISAGAGVHLSKKLSLGYTYERGTKSGIVNLGATHEVVIAFSLTDRIAIAEKATAVRDSVYETEETPEKPEEPERPEPKRKTKKQVQKEKEAEEKAYEPDYDMDAELGRLRLDLDEEDQHLLEILLREDSLIHVQKAELEKKIKNLKEYARREKAARQRKQLSIDTESQKAATAATAGDNPDSGALQGETPATLPEPGDTDETDEIIEKDIREYYAKKTRKPRKNLEQINHMMIDNAEPGYYIIANVFATNKNADAFMQSLKNRGISAKSFYNPKNHFRYVYLKRHNTWREALISYYSNVDNTYFDPIWISSVNIIK